MDQEEFHNAVIGKTLNDKIQALHIFTIYFKKFLAKDQAWEDIQQLAKDENAEVRSAAAGAIGEVFVQLPYKDQAWKILLQLAMDNNAGVRSQAASAISKAFSQLPDKGQAQKDLVGLATDKNPGIRSVKALAIGKAFSQLPDKDQAQKDLIDLAKDDNSDVRSWSAQAIIEAYGQLPDKDQAWKILLQLTKDNNAGVKSVVTRAIGKAFNQLPDKDLAWTILLQLAEDKNTSVRSEVARSIVGALGEIPHKDQAWKCLLQLLKDENTGVRSGAAKAIIEAFGQLPDKEQAQKALIGLALDENADIRSWIAQVVSEVSGELPDKDQAWKTLLQLASDNNAGVRSVAARSIGKVFGQLTDKDLEQKDLIGLAYDGNPGIRSVAALAIGKAFGQLPDEDRAWKVLLQLATDKDASTRSWAALAISEAIGQLSNQDQAWKDIEQLIRNEYADVRSTAKTILETRGSRTELPSSKIPRLDISPYAVSDSTGGKDLLGFTVYAQALGDFIKNKNIKKPITIGIDAAWGMGKTFLMEMICRELVGEERCKRSHGGSGIENNATGYNSKPDEIVSSKEDKGDPDRQRCMIIVWFNAWKYDKEGSLWAALILEILRQLRQQLGFREWIELLIKVNFNRFDLDSLLEKIIHILILALPIALLSTVLALFNLSVTKYDLVGQLMKSFQYYGLAWILGVIASMILIFKYLYKNLVGPFDLNISQYLKEPDYRERIGFLAQFEEDFGRVIDIATNNGRKTVVIFIDDLDRCSPPKPVEIIEAINTLIDAKHCVFVIGMDGKAVASSIEAKYQDLRDYLYKAGDPAGISLGQRFLDKIIQINFRIPTVEKASLLHFTKHMIPVADSIKEINEQVSAQEVMAKSVEGSTQPQEEQNTPAHSSDPLHDIQGKSAGIVKSDEKDALQDVESEGERNQKIEEFATNFESYPEVLEAINDALPFLRSNPRRIKKFMNSFRLLALISNRRRLLNSQAIRLNLLAKWAIIQIRWPDIIDTLEIDESFIERLKRAQELKGKIQRSSDEMRKSMVESSNELVSAKHLSGNEILVADRRSLNHLLADPKISRMVDESEFIALVEKFQGTLCNYIYLSQLIRPGI